MYLVCMYVCMYACMYVCMYQCSVFVVVPAAFHSYTVVPLGVNQAAVHGTDVTFICEKNC